VHTAERIDLSDELMSSIASKLVALDVYLAIVGNLLHPDVFMLDSKNATPLLVVLRCGNLEQFSSSVDLDWHAYRYPIAAPQMEVVTCMAPVGVPILHIDQSYRWTCLPSTPGDISRPDDSNL
jgi:hypothetical protein